MLSAIAGGLALFSLASSALAQGPNLIADDPKYAGLGTMASNATFFILPLEKSIAANLVKPYKLLPTSIPGFPTGFHPLFVTANQFGSDIRQTFLNLQTLQIPAELGGSLLIPFTDRLNDGHTPFATSLVNWNNASIPATVATVGLGIPSVPAIFNPPNAAYAKNSANVFSSQIKTGLTNPLGNGPTPINEALDAIFWPIANHVYDQSVYKAILAQPLILQGLQSLQCFKAEYIYGQSFSNPFYVLGNITIFDPYLKVRSPGLLPPPVTDGTARRFFFASGWTTSAQLAQHTPAPCTPNM